MSEQPIQLYRPSNGDEGDGFIDGWCAHCRRDKVMNGQVELDDAGDDDYCEVLGRSYRTAEALPEWVYGENGPLCTAHEPLDGPEPRCAYTADMFVATGEPQP